MDLVTHALSGMAIGAACAPTERERLPMMIVGAAAAVTPDLDALARLASPEAAWRHHRVLLHGLPTLPLQGAVLWIAAGFLWPGLLPAESLALCVGASLLAHLLLDSVTSFGTALGYPFSRHRYSSRTHFIIDPVILGALGVAVVAGKPVVGLALTLCWLLVGVGIRHRLQQVLRMRAAETWDGGCEVLLEPGPWAPFRWLVVVRHPAPCWWVSEATWRGRLKRPWQQIRSEGPPAWHERASRLPLIRAFLETCDCPRWTVIRQEGASPVLMVEDLKWWVMPPFRPLAFLVRLAVDAKDDQARQMPMWWTAPESRQSMSLADIDHRHSMVIVTTASPPWFTGTSINPLYRAREFARRGWRVTVVFPWIPPSEQVSIFPAGLTFATQAEQAGWIRAHLDADAVDINFYPASWHRRWRSIFPQGPLAPHIPAGRLLILEEPEHLGLFQPHIALRRQVNAERVVGILHTNYPFYVQSTAPSLLRPVAGAALGRYLSFVAHRNCDDLISLSPALSRFKGARIENVHGVAPPFLEVTPAGNEQGLYFIGKLVWEKGLAEALSLLADAGGPPLHVFGSGEPSLVGQMTERASRLGVQLVFHGPCTRPWQALEPYKVFVNCSRSEVLCTATAEALAMGKFALVPRHPSNTYFEAHPNCLVYDSPAHFRQLLERALASTPESVNAADWFSWESAHERLMKLLTEQIATRQGHVPSPPGVPMPIRRRSPS